MTVIAYIDLEPGRFRLARLEEDSGGAVDITMMAEQPCGSFEAIIKALPVSDDAYHHTRARQWREEDAR